MPIKDPEKRREYNREYQRDYKRVRRAGEGKTPGKTDVPVSFRLKTAQDIVALLEEQVSAVREEKDAGTLEKARVIGYLCGIALRAVEVADLSARVEMLEQIVKGRKAA